MSEEKENVPEPKPEAPPAPEPAVKAREKKARKPRTRSRWWRRLYLALLALVAVGVVSRLVVMIALPPVIRDVAAHYGLKADYEKMELYLLNGDVGIWHFSLTPVEGGGPIVQSDYTRLHISTLDLLRGRLTVRRLESEGVDLQVDRKADGSIPLLARFAQWMKAASANKPPAAGQTAPAQRTIDLGSPLEIDAFRLSNIHAHVVDQSVSPPTDAMVEVNLRLTDLDSPDRPTRFEMDLTGAPILDLMHVEGMGTSNGESLQADMTVAMKGLHPLSAAGYLNEMGIQPISGSVTAEMNAHVRTTPTANAGTIAANVLLDHVTVTADGEEAAALDQVKVNADAINYTTAHIAQIDIQGGRCLVRRDARGETGVAGLQVIEPVVLVHRLEVPLTAALRLIPQHWSVGALAAHDLGLKLNDQTLAPGAEVALKLKELTLNGFSPERPNDVTTFRGVLSAPGIAANVHLDGQFRPFGATKSADLTISADGIKPDALRPYLDDLGLQSDYTGGTFSTAVHVDVTPGAQGTLTTNAILSKLALNDGGQLLAMDSVEVSGAAYDPAAGRLHIKSIDISGPKLATGREIGGGIAALGLHTKARQEQAAPAGVPGVRGAMEMTHADELKQYFFSLPKLRIDQFTWKAVGVDFSDRDITPNTSLAISDAGVEVTDLNIDFDPKDVAAQPGKLHAWVNAPNLAQSIVVDGTVSPSAEGMSADLSVDGSGVTSDALVGYFASSRIRPVLHDGTIHFTTHLAAEKTDAGVAANLEVNDFAYKNGADNLVTVDLASAGGVAIRNNELSVDQVTVRSPKLWISREADGSLLAGGIRILPRAAADKAPDRLAEMYRTPAARGAERSANGAMPQLVATFKNLELDDAAIQWTDKAMQPPVSAQVTSTVRLADFVFGKDAPPAKFMVTASEQSALDRMTMTGTLSPSPENPAANFAVGIVGLRAGALGEYLGPNIRVNLKDGRCDADVDAALNQNPSGGYGGHLLVNHLEFRDGLAAPLPLCKMDALRLTASRFDLPGGTIALSEIGVDGLDMPATRCKDGTIQLLGVNLSRPVAAAPAADPPSVTGNVSGVGIANLAAVANEKYPLITVDKLDVGVKAIAFSDEFRPDAVPLTLADLHLTNHGRIELLGQNPQTGPPVELEVTGAANPLIASMDIQGHITPFADPAVAAIDVNLAGIHGGGVTDLLPVLKPDLDGGSLTDGRLTAHLVASFKQPRADPLGVDLSRDFTAGFSIKDVQFKDGATGQAIAGLDDVGSEEIQFQPKNSTITVRELDVTNPSATVYRDGQGIHLMGMVVKPAGLQDLFVQPPVAQKPAEGEIAINKLLVSKLNFSFEDRTCDPPLLVPLNGLDVEVRGLSSRMTDEEKSCRFSALVNAGKVTLPKHNEAGTEERDLFSQAEAGGIVSLYPQPKGWVKGSINALDLAALTGEAKQQGINLGGGTFDATADVRLNGDGTMDLRSRLSFTDLELTEPVNGPITRFLKVGSPLNVVIAALQDQDGSITLPIDVPIRSGHIAGGDIALAATGAVAGVVATAVATTPLKASDAVLSLFGNQKLPKNEQPVTLLFDPADPTLSLQNVLTLRTLLKQAQDDPTLEMALHHAFGGGDAIRAAVLANPSPENSQNLAYGLRLKKIELLAARDAAAQRAAAQIASGFGPDSNAAIVQLRNIDTALATTENAMDEMYDMLRPGAERQADRRTRAACLEIAQDRLLAVRDALLASDIPGIESRIKVTHATINAATGTSGGSIVIVLTHKKNQ